MLCGGATAGRKTGFEHGSPGGVQRVCVVMCTGVTAGRKIALYREAAVRDLVLCCVV